MADKAAVAVFVQGKHHERLKAKFEKHREILEKHKERGPVFKEAVERLERIFNTETST